jgi:ketosteroid isomerase-like protein
MKRWLLAAVLALAAAAAHADAVSTDATLKKITQEMADALAPGDRAVWERYTDPSLLFVTEDNLVKTRTQFLADLAPLPAGYSGQIAIVEFQSKDYGAFAVTTYIQDEHENVEGHELHAHYRTTDTWRRTPAGWRLAASETFSVPIDPPAGTASADALASFEGRYRLSAKTAETIRRDGDHLVVEREGRAPQILVVASGDVFFTPGRPRTMRVFQRDSAGRVIGFADRREGVDLVWTKQIN